MASADQADITAMLTAWAGGDTEALDRLMDIVYPELRRVARRHLAQAVVTGSLESAALANEAYLKLVRAGSIRCENRVHFLALCAQVMRRILVDHARGRQYAKRGGDKVHVGLEQVLLLAQSRGVELVALDEALERLARMDPRKSRVVELRYFGGLTIEEAAVVLEVSADTAKRDWRLARAWLRAQLSC